MNSDVVTLLPASTSASCVEDGDEAGSRTVVVPVLQRTGAYALSLLCGFYPTVIQGNTCHEFAFSIIVDQSDAELPSFETQDRKSLLRFLPPEFRQPLLDTVLVCVRHLIADVAPIRIFRVTKTRNMPSKAMRKHDLITSVMQSNGYTVIDDGLDRAGRRYWMLQRL
ncbi:MAG: hypothetical protein P1U65_14835 [Minwuia sp.]|nr:hypothetical protein [Minwuia sp.]